MYSCMLQWSYAIGCMWSLSRLVDSHLVVGMQSIFNKLYLLDSTDFSAASNISLARRSLQRDHQLSLNSYGQLSSMRVDYFHFDSDPGYFANWTTTLSGISTSHPKMFVEAWTYGSRLTSIQNAYFFLRRSLNRRKERRSLAAPMRRTKREQQCNL